jgi:hypothetical protein
MNDWALTGLLPVPLLPFFVTAPFPHTFFS